MASSPRVQRAVSLEEFLRMPDIDESPGLEYIDGRIEAKVAPRKLHSVIQMKLGASMDRFGEQAGLGLAFMKLRCTFDGRSILPDVSFLLAEHLTYEANGMLVEETLIPPDNHVEIISPDRRVKRSREKLIHSTSHGCALGVLIHPYRKLIEVYRPGEAIEQVPADGAIDFAPVLPGFVVPFAEVFGWLSIRIQRPKG